MGKKKIQRAAAAEHYLQALRLRALGLPPETIAARLGLPDAAAAETAIQRALAYRRRSTAALADYLLPMEVEKLDRMEAKVAEVLEREHYYVSASGKLALDPVTGAPLVDDMPVLQAVDRALKIADRRSRLLGLDAPSRSESRSEVWTIDVINTHLAELEQEIARRASGAAPEAPSPARREITAGTGPILDADILPDGAPETITPGPPGSSPAG